MSDLMDTIERGETAAEQAKVALNCLIDRVFFENRPDTTHYSMDYRSHQVLAFLAFDQIDMCLKHLESALEKVEAPHTPAVAAIIQILDSIENERDVKMIFRFVQALTGNNADKKVNQ